MTYAACAERRMAEPEWRQTHKWMQKVIPFSVTFCSTTKVFGDPVSALLMCTTETCWYPSVIHPRIALPETVYSEWHGGMIVLIRTMTNERTSRGLLFKTNSGQLKVTMSWRHNASCCEEHADYDKASTCCLSPSKMRLKDRGKLRPCIQSVISFHSVFQTELIHSRIDLICLWNPSLNWFICEITNWNSALSWRTNQLLICGMKQDATSSVNWCVIPRQAFFLECVFFMFYTCRPARVDTFQRSSLSLF